MPLTQTQVQARLAAGKPFIVGTYLGATPSTLNCKTKLDPSKKELRVIIKHTVYNPAGVHVHSEFMPPGSRVDLDKAGQIVAIFDERGQPKVSAIKPGTEVVVTLDKYARDGVGIDILGHVEIVA